MPLPSRAAPVLASAAVLFVLAACAQPAEPGESRVLGVVDFYQDSVVVDVPDTATAGQEVRIMVRTYGGGCERMGPTETQQRGDTVFVTPWDFTVRGPHVACTDILRMFDHTASAAWSHAGQRVVVVRGMEEPAGVERRWVRVVHVR